MFMLRTMADLLQNSSTSRFDRAIWTVKLALLSIGVLSTFLLFKLAVPYSINLIVSAIPRIWFFFCSCLAPPYLYIVVNFIIISIAASSSFQQKQSEKKTEKNLQNQQQQKQREFEASDLPGEKSPDSDDKSSSVGKSEESPPEIWSDISCVTDSDEKLPLSTAVTEPVVDLLLLDNAAEDCSSDSMEDTWTAIMEGRKPPTRQLKKSETWDTPPSVEPKPSAVAARRELRKSETFNEGSSTKASAPSGSGGPGLLREMSMSQDDLNRRVEAFIHKFRLQRQESHKHYLATLNRGCY